jgi:hypothetical protein
MKYTVVLPAKAVIQGGGKRWIPAQNNAGMTLF